MSVQLSTDSAADVPRDSLADLKLEVPVLPVADVGRAKSVKSRQASAASMSTSAFAAALDVLADTIQPFPTFSEIYINALKALRGEIAAASKAVGAGPPMSG